MVFVVASHTMVVNASTNPDGTMKHGKTPTNLPKSDLRGRWVKEDPRLAVVPAAQGSAGYTYTTKATSVRTREDHGGLGNKISYADIFSTFDEPKEALEFASPTRALGRPMSSSSDAVSKYNELYEPVSTVTEKFKSVTTRQPLRTWTTPAQRATSTEYVYQVPVFSAVSYKPPIATAAITTTPTARASRASSSRTQPTRASSPPSTALVPFEKSSFPDSYTSNLNIGRLEPRKFASSVYGAKSAYTRSAFDELAYNSPSTVHDAPKRPPISAAYPVSFRGLTLVANVHDRDSRDYTLPPRRHHQRDYTNPATADYGRPLPAAPTGFYRAADRGRRYSLPARPTDVLIDTYDEDTYVPYAARRQPYVPRTAPAPQVTNVPTRSYSPTRTYSPSIQRRSRAADVEARLESMMAPDPVSMYAGLRSRTAEARSKMDTHKVMLDRYLPIYLGPEREVGMPDYERYRPSTQPSKVAPYRPTERRMSLPSTPTRVVAPSPPQRPPMSDARKRAREVLCKTKHDPEYFSY